MERLLHRPPDGRCYTNSCHGKAKDHNKLYWYEGDAIWSATYCRNCYYKITTARPVWMQQWDEVFVESFTHFKTLRECRLDLITRRLSNGS